MHAPGDQGLISRFWAWYTRPAEDEQLGQDLRRDASYDAGHPRLGIDEFVWGVQNGPGFERLRVLEQISSVDGGAVLFEGVDPVTGLRHREALFVSIAGGRIRSIRHVFMLLPQA